MTRHDLVATFALLAAFGCTSEVPLGDGTGGSAGSATGGSAGSGTGGTAASAGTGGIAGAAGGSGGATGGVGGLAGSGGAAGASGSGGSGGTVACVPAATGGTLTELLNNAPQLFAVTESGDTVYYVVDSNSAPVTVGSVKKDGSNPGKIAGATEAAGKGPTVVKHDGSHLYWLAGGIQTAAYRRPLVGGAVEKLTTAVVPGSTALALGTNSVFWSGFGSILKTPKAGGISESPYTPTAGRHTGIHMASNGTDVVWIEWIDANDNPASTHIIRKGNEKGDAAQTLVSTAVSHPWGIAIDATSAYYSLAGKEINSVPLAGGAPTVLHQGQVNSHLAIDASTVYFLEIDGDCRSLKSVPKSGGTVATLATGLPGKDSSLEQGNHIAVDATDIFVGTFSGSIFKISK